MAKHMAKRRTRKQRRQRRKRITNAILSLFLIGILGVGLLLYGPYSGFRDWIITVSMTSMTHHWIAELIYPQKVIDDVLANNRVDEIKEDTKTEEIQIANKEEVVEEKVEEKQYKNEYEKQILAPNLDKKKYNIYEDKSDYRIINIKGKGYTGYLAVIYDPSKIRTLVTSKLGVTGQYLTTMAKNNNAKLAINGGKFYDKIFNFYEKI